MISSGNQFSVVGCYRDQGDVRDLQPILFKDASVPMSQPWCANFCRQQVCSTMEIPRSSTIPWYFPGLMLVSSTVPVVSIAIVIANHVVSNPGYFHAHRKCIIQIANHYSGNSRGDSDYQSCRDNHWKNHPNG